MGNQIILTTPIQQRPERDAITIEEYQKRKVQRRRRVAKRKLKAVPLFAVEEMQPEFPGYTYDEFVADVTRKTRKGKSFRRPKPKAFDWNMIYKDAPEIFYLFRERYKTKGVLRGKMKDGTEFTAIVHSIYWNGSGESRLDTYTLLRLLRGPLKTFIEHPAVRAYRHRTEITD